MHPLHVESFLVTPQAVRRGTACGTFFGKCFPDVSEPRVNKGIDRASLRTAGFGDWDRGS